MPAGDASVRLVRIIAAALLGLFSQCAGCAHTFVCDVFSSARASERIVRENIADKVFDVESGTSGLIAVVGFDDHANRILERRLENESDPAPRPLAVIQMRQIEGEGLTSVNGEVWYSAAGNYGGKWGAVFLNASRAESPAFLELPLAGAVRWLPLGGARAAGLYLSDDSSSCDVRLVTPNGVVRTWQIPHRLATARALASAALSENAVVLAFVPDDRDAAAPAVIVTVLEVQADQPAPIGRRIARANVSRLALATQLDGTIGVLLQSGSTGLEFAQLSTSGALVMRSLTPEADATQAPVLAAGEHGGFIAAWYVRDGTDTIVTHSIPKSSLASLRAIPIGRGRRTNDNSLALRIVRNDSGVSGVWIRDASIVSRPLFTGFEAVEILRPEIDRFCSHGKDDLLTLIMKAWVR